MSDDLLQQLSSNSNSSLDPSMSQKMAKLEARMAGKAAPTSPQAPWLSEIVSTKSDGVTTISASGDSDSDDAGEFVIQPNPRLSASSSHDDQFCRKRKRLPEASCKRSHQFKEVLAAQIAWQEEKVQVQEEIISLQAKVSSLEEELAKFRKEASNANSTIKRFEKDMTERADREQQREQKRIKVVSDLLVQLASVERQASRSKLQHESNKLGNIGVMRGRAVLSEVWEDGQAFKDVQARLRALIEQKAALEKHRKGLKKQPSDGSNGEPAMSEEDVMAMEEVYRFRLLGVKREEDSAFKDRDRLEQEKKCLIRELKRCRDEDASPFNHFPILNKRYALLNLLGKGGFSEVYKAYDLVEYRYVACKLHRLNEQWSEEKKQTFVRHAIREYNIHKSLVHRHIVRLWDIFEIDRNTFCTVLEFCSGKDLDVILKETPILPEREARSILVQIFSGLVKLNKQAQRIIHYDLKPANILFNSVGVAKITDFGLSKIVEEESGSLGMELTSQGAGTYWYLPPECFDLHKTPLISSKVDVWSVGVICYQMLFGKRPFGHDQCQEQLVREDTIVNARKVEFPTRPSVSLEAKDFMRRCLTYDQADRPDVLTAAQDPYLSYMKKKP